MTDTDGIPCPEPGCDGIIEDGYCTVTGLAYRPPAATARTGAATAGSTGPAGSAGSAGSAQAAVARAAGPGRPDASRTGAGTHQPTGSLSSASRSSASRSSAQDSVQRTSGTSTGGSTGGSRRNRRGTASRTSPGRLGAGLVDVPDIPVPDPTSMLLADPQIPEHRRTCTNCREPVGRARGNQPAHTDGFCAGCGHAFSFVPALRAGDRVGQYEIAGALAHGGQGWIYLARDPGVAENFWVVLKGLLDSGDAQAQAAAIAERRFLASVDHPGIVRIFTFVEHEGTGYIVMEYVGGTSLREVLRNRRAAAGRTDPLPVAEAIAYLLAVLPAFAYLHRNGLVFCDFKPDNVMLGRETVRLIDLGAVRRLDDDGGAVYGTKGYQAPEVETAGPSVASDLFTLGRTLASLILDFRGNTSTFRYTLPPADDHPVLDQHESLYRFLIKATAFDPDDRFTDADEMQTELLGVLREIVAGERGTPVAAPSRRFAGDRHLTGELPLTGAFGAPGSGQPDPADLPPWTVLPGLRVDPDDPAAGPLAALPDTDPAALAELLAAMGPSAGVRLRLARTRLQLGDPAAARAVLDGVEAEDPFEWRVDWERGLLALADGDADAARIAFDRVYAQVPGELAPKLALARTAESAGDLARAEQLYDLVSRTDDSFTSAAFGLARVRIAVGDRDGAVAAYGRVPPASAAFVDAQVRLARVLGTVTAAGAPGRAEIASAAGVFAGLELDPGRRAALTRDLLTTSLELVTSGALPADGSVTIAGSALRDADLRFGLERAYRDLARLAATPADRYALVDLANSVRPRTLV